MKNNLMTQMIYRIILCCLSGIAVLLTFRWFICVYVGKEDFMWLGDWVNEWSSLDWRFIYYYTNISNWFVFAASVIVLNDTVKRVRAGEREGHNRVIKAFKFMTTVMILVTCLIYIFTLGNPLELSYWRNIYNIFCHMVVPIMFIVDFFLFDEHKIIKWYYPLLSAIIPLIYVVYVMILGACIKDFDYPYFFLDVNWKGQGYGGVVLWVILFAAIFIGLGYLMWLYDKLVKKDGKYKLDFSRPEKEAASEQKEEENNS